MPDSTDSRTVQNAIDGLLYPSESDEPFEVFCWPGTSASEALQAVETNAGIEGPAQRQTPDDFFTALAESPDAPRFAVLRETLESSLKDLAVIRAGEVQVGVFLIGRDREGNWSGVRTVSIET